MATLEINEWIAVPLEEFQFEYARSGGPGGQNVNKVNSKAILRWKVLESPSLPFGVKQRFEAAFKSRITTEGELVLSSQKYRDQSKNVDDCLEKLQTMLQSVAEPPKPRRATKPTKASKIRRVETKREDSKKKQQRKKPMDW